MTIALGSRRYIMHQMMKEQHRQVMLRMLSARFPNGENGRFRFDDPFTKSVMQEYMHTLMLAETDLHHRIKHAGAADLNRLFRLLFGGAAGPGGSLRRVNWDVVNAWAAQTYPRYMAGKRIASIVTRQMVSPHTAVGRKRLLKNFERTSKNQDPKRPRRS